VTVMTMTERKVIKGYRLDLHRRRPLPLEVELVRNRRADTITRAAA
jgi:hypothetical protein